MALLHNKNIPYMILYKVGDRRRRDRMVVRFAITYTISAYHHYSCEFESHSGKVYSI
jgi:hypothetical protein